FSVAPASTLPPLPSPCTTPFRSRTLSHLLPLGPAQLQAQLLGNLFRDLFLHRKHIGQLAIVLLAPELRARGDLHQFSVHYQGVTTLEHSPREHHLHAQIVPDLLRIHVTALKSHHLPPLHD